MGGRQGLALAQLPAATAGFTGRDDELKVFAGLLDPAGTSGPVVVSAVAGLAGVGKATLAVEAGHAAQGRRRGAFVDLHGYDEAPVQPEQALDVIRRRWLSVVRGQVLPTDVMRLRPRYPGVG